MNPARKLLHAIMEFTGLDSRVDVGRVHLWNEKRRQSRKRRFSIDEGNVFIRDALESGRPLAVGKIGDIELAALCWHLKIRRFYKYTLQPPSFGELELDSNAGVFPRSAESFRAFAEIYLDSLSHLDLAGVWFNSGEDKVLSRHAPRAARVELKALEPWFASSGPWSAALAGKRVLVVHPFVATMRAQYERREAVWRGREEMLPGFLFRALKSPYGFSANEFRDWSEMVSCMEDQMERIQNDEGFDVALIGCGAASIPLVAKAKSMGKVGIHMGGPLQLLFGIRGRRWDLRPEFQNFFNDTWCRPTASETPFESAKVDHGGYW